MTVTTLRMQFHKLKARILFYKDCIKFSNETFMNSPEIKFGSLSISPDENGFLNFYKIFTKTLNKYAPCKRQNYGEIKNNLISKTIIRKLNCVTSFRNIKHKK